MSHLGKLSPADLPTSQAWDQEDSIHVGTQITWKFHKPYSSEIIGWKEGQVINISKDNDVEIKWEKSSGVADAPVVYNLRREGPAKLSDSYERISMGDIYSARTMGFVQFKNERWH